MGLVYLEEELDVPLYGELDTNKTTKDAQRIFIGLDLKDDRIVRTIDDEQDKTIYIDVPTFVRG